MADPDEIVELFLNFPGELSQSQKSDYDRIYDPKFEAHVPSPKKGGGLIKYSKDEWLSLIKSLVLGIENFNFHGSIWTPMEYENPGVPGFEDKGNPMDPAWDEEMSNNESFVADGQKLRHVHITTSMTGVHTGDGPQLLKLEGCDLKPTGKEVVWPLEWWTLTINAQKVPPSLVRLKFIKVLDTARCSTGGYSLVPGCLFAIGKPLPPGPVALEHPFPAFPPLDAVDLNDPNWWQMRNEIFRQIHEKTDEEKKEIKRLIDRQVKEMQQHIDYLDSIEYYADALIENPRTWDMRDKEETDEKLRKQAEASRAP
mmetsp:Transcript_61605/g.99597  ORF Transcript_61605/g.99597 Transcript_61605/m.99597 type:complete len:312 (+) Transcript_61605:19-954(+)